MAATPSLKVINTFVLSGMNVPNGNIQMQQGAYNNIATTPYDIATEAASVLVGSVALSGLVYADAGTLATANAQKVYDSSVIKPATFNYLWIWCDQAWTVQLITSATNVALDQIPNVPFVMGSNRMLAAASTSAISSSAPSTTAIATIYIGNYSGSTLNYQIAAIL